MCGLQAAWGSKALDKYAEEIASTLLATATSADRSDEQRITAVEQLIAFQPQSNDAVTKALDLISAKTPPEFATQVIAALSASQATGLGRQLIERVGTFSPVARAAAIRVLLGRAETTNAFLDAVQAGTMQLADLSLDQKQALSAHPNFRIRGRVRRLLEQAGGLPNPDREKVIAQLSSEVEKDGDAAAGKVVFKNQCAKCHMHSGEGEKIGPDLTGMAVHPKHELLVNILDPSRSVEGNFRVYTATLADGRVLSGMLAGESKTAIELIDTEAKRHSIPREDLDELTGSQKSLMPEGFEQQVKPEDIRNLLEFLTTRGKYFPLDLAKVATVVSTKGMFNSEDSPVERLVFPDWGPKTVDGVPFYLVDPDNGSPPECSAALQHQRHDPAAHAQVGHARLPVAGQGDSLAEWRGRVGISLWRKGIGLDDRSPALCRRLDRRSRA